MTTPAPPSQVEKGPEEWTLPKRVTIGKALRADAPLSHLCTDPQASPPVDNDPHFIVHLPRGNMDVCFNINSRPGHILNLVSDSGKGTRRLSPPGASGSLTLLC